MSKTVRAIPEGYHSITPGFGVAGCDQAVAFYKKVFGAEEHTMMKSPDGTIMHAELRIGDSLFMCGERKQDPYTMNVMLYVTDVDAVVKRAVDAGATLIEPVKDQFWGDRAGRVKDPFGNEWFIATHVEDVTPDEMKKRMAALMGG